jgi:phage FluMu gp28-like protein
MNSPALEEHELKLILVDDWANNPWHFIRDTCITIDEADDGKTKAFPDLDYLRIVCEQWQENKLLAVPKSRRMMLTWVMLALHLHLALFTPNSAIFIQSKKYLDACYLLSSARLMFMYYNLPEWLKEFGLPTVAVKEGLLKFSNGSMIKAIAQGADQLRQYTATAVMCDEIAFMEQAESTWTALRPVLQGGGRCTMISSVNPGFFERICHGKLQNRSAAAEGL